MSDTNSTAKQLFAGITTVLSLQFHFFNAHTYTQKSTIYEYEIFADFC